MTDKPKLAIYWASSCGGCEIAVLNTNERLLDILERFELVFCPCLMDTKVADVEAMPDGAIGLTLLNGAIRTGENHEMAELLRAKSRVLVAFGSCAIEGCVPGMANLHPSEGFLRDLYMEGPTVDNPRGMPPQKVFEVGEGTLYLPEFLKRVRTLAQSVDVDYYVPGCPPEPGTIWKAFGALLEGIRDERAFPRPGSVLGAGVSNVCNECTRKRGEKKIARLRRNFEAAEDTERCLLEQGFICMGIATRDGCGALCPKVNMPCTGCYGPPEGVHDQGARMVGALASLLDVGDDRPDDAELFRRLDAIISGIDDYAGTFYRYSLLSSIFGGRVE